MRSSDACTHLGVVADQLNLMGVLLHLAIVASANVAIIYDALVVSQLSRRARGRELGVDPHQIL